VGSMQNVKKSSDNFFRTGVGVGLGARQLLMTNLPGPPLNLQTRLRRCAGRWPFVSVSIQVLVISRSLIQPLTVLSLMPFFVCFAMLTILQITMTLKFPHIDLHPIARNSGIDSQTPENA